MGSLEPILLAAFAFVGKSQHNSTCFYITKGLRLLPEDPDHTTLLLDTPLSLDRKCSIILLQSKYYIRMGRVSY